MLRDLEIIITAHAEGALMHSTLMSVFRSMEVAAQTGIKCGVTVVKDRPSTSTNDYLKRYDTERLRQLEADFGDPGLARNLGVQVAESRFVSFLDADDLISAQWLSQAFEFLAEAEGHPFVAVPRQTLIFERESRLLTHPSSDSPELVPEEFVNSNYWCSVISVLNREMANEVPFSAVPRNSGLGYEDWHWFSELIAAGATIKAIPETISFYRRKGSSSRFAIHEKDDSLLPPSSLFAPRNFVKFVETDAAAKISGEVGMATGSVKSVAKDLRTRAQKHLRTKPKVRSLYLAVKDFGDQLNFNDNHATLPDWAVSACDEINSIEPAIAPTAPYLAQVLDRKIELSFYATAYLELCRLSDCGFTHVMMVPWMKKGGADLESLNYAKLIVEHCEGSRLLILATESSESSWKSRVPQPAIFYEFGSRCFALRDEEQERLLGTFLTQLKPSVIHVLNSRLGYRVFERYGRQLRRSSSLFASVFCEDYSTDGHLTGYPVVQLPRVSPYLDGVFADNARILKLVKDDFACSANQYLHYQPTEIVERCGESRRSDGLKLLNVLWAGRLDRQKRPDLLIEIAQKCRNLPVTFHVYGETLLEKVKVLSEIKSLENIEYKGKFDGAVNLPFEEFDLFLCSSQWEGLPNLMVDMCAAGIAVISSNAGGIGELVVTGETGILVEPFDNIDAYVKAINWFIDNPESLESMGLRAAQLVKNRHSWQAFVDSVNSVSGYLH
ncbi:glycosyltransferase [Pseudomonadota bacterium]